MIQAIQIHPTSPVGDNFLIHRRIMDTFGKTFHSISESEAHELETMLFAFDKSPSRDQEGQRNTVYELLTITTTSYLFLFVALFLERWAKYFAIETSIKEPVPISTGCHSTFDCVVQRYDGTEQRLPRR